MKKLIIVGDRGQGRAVLDCALSTKEYSKIAFLVDHDIDKTALRFDNVEYICEKNADYKLLVKKYKNLIVAEADNATRVKKIDYYKDLGFNIPTLIHSSAVVSKFAEIGEGTVVFANASVNACTEIGRGCIINTKANVDHDSKLADGVHLSPGVSMGGYVEIGENTWIGVGASVRSKIQIGKNTMIGMGSVVTKSVGDNVVAYGSPCKVIRENN